MTGPIQRSNADRPSTADDAQTAIRGFDSAAAALFVASPNPIIAVDATGRISFANAQVSTAFGYEPEDLIGHSIEVLLPDGVGTRHDDHVRGFFEKPVARPMGVGREFHGRHHDGHLFPVEIGLSPVESDSGVHVFVTIVDISARRISEAELLQAQKLESVGRLAGGIAHDFNNILFAIAGYSELLEEDLGGEAGTIDVPNALQSVKAITDAAKRGAGLTGQLAAFSRQHVVSAQVIDLDEAIRKVGPMLRTLISTNIDFRLELESGGALVKVDPSQFDQIVVNLAVNARDAMPSGGTLYIASETVELDIRTIPRHAKIEAGTYAVVTVSDTGAGMDEPTRLRAFEPFFTTKPSGKGTGLGLATSYGIVRQADGHITIQSEPGRGSIFKVYLPLAAQPAQVIRGPAGASGESPDGELLLVVEDEPAVRDVTTRLLKRAGYRVVAAANGAEALAAASGAGEPIAALVTDAVMPGMSGMELVDSFHELHPGVAVVILSGYSPEKLDPGRAIARGAHYVGKPISSRALLAAVRAATAQKQDG